MVYEFKLLNDNDDDDDDVTLKNCSCSKVYSLKFSFFVITMLV